MTKEELYELDLSKASDKEIDDFIKDVKNFWNDNDKLDVMYQLIDTGTERYGKGLHANLAKVVHSFPEIMSVMKRYSKRGGQLSWSEREKIGMDVLKEKYINHHTISKDEIEWRDANDIHILREKEINRLIK